MLKFPIAWKTNLTFNVLQYSWRLKIPQQAYILFYIEEFTFNLNLLASSPTRAGFNLNLLASSPTRAGFDLNLLASSPAGAGLI